MSDDCDQPQQTLISYEQALDTLLDKAVAVVESETLPLIESLGRIVADPVISTINVPPADNSAMDGYAIRIADLASEGSTRLPVRQRIAAGQVGEPLEAGTAARIFTGAPIPDGADAVIMQEQVEQVGDDMVVEVSCRPSQNIRRAGEDIEQGHVVLQPGKKIRAQEMGLAASIGVAHLKVKRRLKVGLFFTGNELVEPGEPLEDGQIYDSNRYSLVGLLKAQGCEIVDLGIVGDSFEQTCDAIELATRETDLVLTSGGVSVGEEDHVRAAIENMGELLMWKINIKPGKPLVFGNVNNTEFIGLPGNPVSAFATYCLFVAPYIRKCQGNAALKSTVIPVIADFEHPKPGKRREFLRAKIELDQDSRLLATLFPHQGSGVLTSTSWAEGFVVADANQTISKGDVVDYLSFKELLD